MELNKRFLEGYQHFHDEPKIQELRRKVLKYNRLVRDLGMRDHQVCTTMGDLSLVRSSYFITGTSSSEGRLEDFGSPPLPNRSPDCLDRICAARSDSQRPYLLDGVHHFEAESERYSEFSRQLQQQPNSIPEALAASVVKIAGRDVLATWKVLISLGVTPVLYAFYAFLATLIAIKANAPMKWRIWTPFIVILVLPFIGYAALKFGEAGMDVLKSVPLSHDIEASHTLTVPLCSRSLRPLIVAVVPGQQQYLNRLKQMRQDLSNELAEVINEFGPKLYGEDFDKVRAPSVAVIPSLVLPSSKPKPSFSCTYV